MRRICAPLAVYDERGRVVLLCCAPALLPSMTSAGVLRCCVVISAVKYKYRHSG